MRNSEKIEDVESEIAEIKECLHLLLRANGILPPVSSRSAAYKQGTFQETIEHARKQEEGPTQNDHCDMHMAAVHKKIFI
jgi:hypothetical protein